MADHPGNRFGEVAVREGFATRAQVRECLEIQAKLREYGVPPKKLGEIMVEKGYLADKDVKAILEVQELSESQSRTETRSGLSGFGSRRESAVLPIAIGLDERGDALPPLKEIPGYEILELLGQGGMGAVYKARQKSLDRIVALKVLPARAARDEGFIKKFISEARTVARLNHENIIAGIDVGEADGTYYFVMEHVDGVSLAKLIDKEGALEESRALKITLQIARALEHAHKHGLVHRDVKPQNVLVSRRTSTENGTTTDLAKLCDLGLAKSLDEEHRISHGEREGMPLGTPHYLSPEQARGEADVDIRSDIYSLGATLYHALTGRTPFDGQSPMVLMTKHLTEEPVSPRKRNPEVTKSASELVMKMMEKEKEDRHQTPAELIDDVERVLDGKKIAASPARSRPSSTGPKTTRKKRPREGDEAQPRERERDRERRGSGSGYRMRATALRAGPGNERSGFVPIFIVGVLLLSVGVWFVAKNAVQPTVSIQEEEAAHDDLVHVKGNIANATTEDDKRIVRGQLDRIIQKFPQTEAAREAQRLRESFR